MTPQPATPPLAILAMDVGDGEAILRWAREGHLPTIAGVMERGCRGRLGGREYVCEHGTELSLYGGVSRASHGYYYFRGLRPGTYDLGRIDSSALGVDPFWAHLRGRDRKALIVDAPEISLVQDLPGVQLSNWEARDPFSPPHSVPPDILQEIDRRFGATDMVEEHYHATDDQGLEIYRRLLGRIEKKGAVTRHLLARDAFDLMAVTFYEGHTASHQFWLHRPEARGESPLSHTLSGVFQAIDREMGAILGQMPAETNVIILSTFGMQDQYTSTGLTDEFCRRLGYHARKPPARASLRPIDVARRLIPQRIRFALSQRMSSETQERLLADQFRSGTDWERTTAFSIPSLYTGFIRVNLRGREPRGCVDPGAAYGALLDRIEADLEQLVDPRSNEPAVEHVHRTVDLFGGGPPASLPDLFVEWRPQPYFQERIVHPRAEITQRQSAFCPGSEEVLSGLLAAAGPSIRGRGDLGEISVLDLAPTFLSLLGVPAPSVMTGRPIDGIARG